MKILIIVGIIVVILASLLASDQYYLSYQDQEIKKSDWVQNCVPPKEHQVVPSIGLYNHTHSFDLLTCTWHPTEHGTPGFLESLYISFIEPVYFDIASGMEIKYAYALCTEEINYDAKLKSSELVFTGTVTRLDNYDGPQRVTFFIHDVIKGKVDTPKHVLDNTGKIFHDDDAVTSSSVSVDYTIGKTYKVYVENGNTDSCTTKLTSPPAGYIWEPGPEDGNYYSENPVYVERCEEGYGLSNGVCTTFEEMNKDLPTCDPNPKHDFGKCKKNMEEPDSKLQDVLDNCECKKSGQACIEPELRWWNATHFIDNIDCEYLDRDAFGAPPPEPKPEVTSSYEIVNEDGEKICLGGRGMILNDQCQRIGNYDIETGIPIVNDKEECDKLDGTWYKDRKLCDSKYAPAEYRFQFGPEHDAYDDSEEMKMASEKVYFAEESMGFGSGTGIFNDSHFDLTLIVIALVAGTGSGIGLIIYWRRK
ncbi:hypothetical protein C6990_09580 [Nitrosopumilus sp. b3]|uniref:hypothetical protein n=1 Tax=Nitrosopumilus sp. b3 TaxID=2109909 RepID=UPI0015F4185E|nr:hypothetical protein [Nitrosopumilus sp. b3]KAF6246367.1 hypothetical protein C6990_09580 [Nitrosopumilus sp. b3]